MNFSLAISLATSASNLSHSEVNSAHSSSRSPVKSSSTVPIPVLVGETSKTTAVPPARSTRAKARSRASSNPGPVGMIQVACWRGTAPALRSSRHTATRCRDGSPWTSLYVTTRQPMR